MVDDWLKGIRGFNYSGSWGTSGLDLWQHHDHGAMAVEIARGKAYFPGWNVARWWLSHEAFQRSPARFLANFDSGLDIFGRSGIRVVPVLFNRWRDPVCDFGGVPLDHIVPGFSSYAPATGFTSSGGPFSIQRLFADYLEAVVGKHASDERIVAWDMCNEPFMGPYLTDPDSPIREAELCWLSWCRDVCKAVGANQPLTIGNIPHITAIEITEPVTDVISFHPYYIPGVNNPSPSVDVPTMPVGTKDGFEDFLDDVLDLAATRGKGVFASETVWGATADEDRVALIRYTLGELSKREIGFVVHALHHSLVADLHSAEYGPVSGPGRLEFINADGSLRHGHEAFNEFAAAENRTLRVLSSAQQPQ